MPSPFYLVGPTGVGKTALAVEIASRCGAEIVGADAFQVYEGLDILSAKPSLEQRRRVRHHLVGVLPLWEEYNVVQYLEDARRCLADIAARGVPAIVVGGSGLYVRALTHGLSPLPPSRPELRMQLESWDLAALKTRLQTVDPKALDLVDSANKRRLIRAIEICEATGRPLAAARALWQDHAPELTCNGWFLTQNHQALRGRIERRVAAMVSAGVIEEVRRLDATQLSSTSSKIIGLAELRAHLRGEIDLPDCLQRIATKTRQYAKRQRTWFRNKGGFPCLETAAATEKELIGEAVQLISAA